MCPSASDFKCNYLLFTVLMYRKRSNRNTLGIVKLKDWKYIYFDHVVSEESVMFDNRKPMYIVYIKVDINSLFFGENLSATLSIKLLFVCMFSFIVYVRPKYLIHTIVFEVLIRKLTERAEKLRLQTFK
jgi:hypothetical protein